MFLFTRLQTPLLHFSLFILHEGLTHRFFSYVPSLCLHRNFLSLPDENLKMRFIHYVKIGWHLWGAGRWVDREIGTPSLPPRSLRELKSKQTIRTNLMSVVSGMYIGWWTNRNKCTAERILGLGKDSQKMGSESSNMYVSKKGSKSFLALFGAKNISNILLSAFRINFDR